MKYSFNTSGFYEDWREDIPEDSIDISEDLWKTLVAEQSLGAVIVHRAGQLPSLSYPQPLTFEEQQAAVVESNRLQRQTAYQREADPLFFKAQRGEATHQEWLDKVAEIKARYPA